MLSRLTFAALVLAVSASGASGLAAMIGDAFVKLPQPPGFCELTPQYEFDGRLVAVTSAYLTSAGIRLLAMSADCDQLAAAREGRRRQLDDVAQYQVEKADMKMPPPFSVARKCAILRGPGNGPVATDIGARLDSTAEQVKLNETGSIGVIAEDKNGCYIATLHKAATEAGKEKVLIGLQAATIVSNRAMSVHRYAVYQDAETINAMLAKLQADVAALLAANP